MRKFVLMLMALSFVAGMPLVHAQDGDQIGSESASDGADKSEEDAEPECD